jgi:hypothetical protein
MELRTAQSDGITHCSVWWSYALLSLMEFRQTKDSHVPSAPNNDIRAYISERKLCQE